jgi:hypothetical protein
MALMPATTIPVGKVIKTRQRPEQTRKIQMPPPELDLRSR